MFINKKLRKLDKEITNRDKNAFESYEDSVINVKIDNTNQILSQFNFDSDDKLNPEFSEYLWDKANMANIKEDLEIRLHTNEKINSKEISSAIKKHYKREYIVAKKDLDRNIKFSLIMLMCGLISLSIMFLIYSFNIEYFGLVMEIVAWVFLWESADIYFIERATKKRECVLMQKLYSSKLTIVKEK